MAEQRKVIIVTGGNSGVGLDSAKRLCALGHDVTISVRDDNKGRTAIEEIKEFAPSAIVSYITMELTDPQSIKAFVEKFKASGKKLNILVNNAGLFRAMDDKTRYTARNDSSLEETMIANCMGPFLLTNLLQDELIATGTPESPSRIVNVSSMITTDGAKPSPKRNTKQPFIIDDLMLAKPGNYISGFQSYRNSKLAMNLWSNELAKRLDGSHVMVNTLCPGFIPTTNLARHHTQGCMSCILGFVKLCCCCFTSSVSHGSDQVLSVSFDKDTVSGVFYVYGKPQTEAPEVMDKESQEKIWALCERYSS